MSLDLGYSKLVYRDLAVNSRTRITIPPPIHLVSHHALLGAYTKEQCLRSNYRTDHVPPKPKPASYRIVL